MPTVIPHRLWTAAALVAAAVTFGLPAPAAAHDPGLSSLDVRITANRIVATLSLAALDSRTAVSASGLSVERFALDSVAVTLDGVPLLGVVESHVTDSQSGTSVRLAFPRVAGSRLTVRSDVPKRLARGHRELLIVQGFGSHPLAERMLDAQMNGVDVVLSLGQPTAGGAREFFALGLRHILGGYDHLLFLFALLLGVQRLPSVVKTATAFTIAHSLTLSGAAVGIVRVPASIVEPLIAASIVIVGIENLITGHMESRWRLALGFGLVHGFGFAGALQDVGLGAAGLDVVARLACFNVGVEAGQIGVAALVWPLIRRLNARPEWRARVAPACSLLVVAAGSYWIVDRVLVR